VDGEDEEHRAMTTGCRGGQGSPRVVAPRGWMDGNCSEQILALQHGLTVSLLTRYLKPTG